MAFNVADLFEHAVDTHPDRTALICGGEQLTYRELDERANRLAHHLLDNGVTPGTHVGFFTANSADAVVALVGITKARAVAINVNFRYTAGELRYVLENSQAQALVYQADLGAAVEAVRDQLPGLRHLIAIGADSTPEVTARLGAVTMAQALASGSPERGFEERSPDDRYIIYTGGTTGHPKGVVWRHEDIFRALGGGVDFMTGELVPDEWHLARVASEMHLTRMSLAPLIHGHAQWASWGSFFCANTVVLLPKFDPVAVWEHVEQYKVNVIALIGDAMARPLIEAYHAGSYDTSSILAISSSAALLSHGVKMQFLDAFPNALLTDAIGSTETGFSGIGAVSREAATGRGPRVTAGRDAIIIDEENRPIPVGSDQIGRLARGGFIPLGYYQDPEKTAKLFVEVEGRRYTVPGDMATYESDGSLIMLGRGDQCINTGGEKVFPEEVESALKGHPGVFDALVVGVPDERMGWRVAAVVQWREDAEADAADLDRYGREHLAGYKMPRSYWFTDRVERLATGKPNYPWARTYTQQRPADVEMSTSGRVGGVDGGKA